MNKILKLIRRIFKKQLLLDSGDNEKNQFEKISTDNKKEFLNSIKIKNATDSIDIIKTRLENGLIDESDLSSEEIIKLKNLYCEQIINLKNSIITYTMKTLE